MDKALIFGVFDFVNFHVCKTLLENGIEVIGVHYEEIEDLFLEEKKLEVGRNANFIEQTFFSWAEKNGTMSGAKTTVILSFYDLFMQYHEALLKTKTTPILKFLDRNKDEFDSITILLPLQMLTRSAETQDDVNFQEFLNQIMEVTDKIQLFYLPAIYGPWQPETFLFQQAMLKKINRHKEFKVSRESTADAVYIEDAVETLVEKMNAKKPGSYLLESGKLKHWNKCAEFLMIEEDLDKRKGLAQTNDKIVRVAVKKVTPISESLSNQMEHLQRLYLFR